MHFTSPDALTANGIDLRDQYCAHWYAVGESALVHRTLRELDLYKTTGIIVGAVRRSNFKIPYPGPDFLVMDEDELYVIGSGERLGLFEQLFEPACIAVPSYELEQQ